MVAWFVLGRPQPAPQVVQIQPPDNATDIAPTAPITFTFSLPMDRAQTTQSIRFDPPLRGEFNWQDDQTLVFTPRVRMPISSTLSITVPQTIRSAAQVQAQSDTVSRFTTLPRPMILDSNPSPQARFVYVPDSVHITFSRPMNPEALREQLHITPPLPHQTIAQQDNTFTLRGFFEPRTAYTLTLPAAVPDAEYGIELGAEATWTFTTTAQYPNFSILERGRVLQGAAGAPLVVPTQFTNVSRLDAALYPITAQEFETNAAAPFEAWDAFQPSGPPAQFKSAATNAALDEYMQQEIELAAPQAGTYYLRITTPEGLSDSKLVNIE